MEATKVFSIPERSVEAVNAFFARPDNRALQLLFDVVSKYGNPEQINEKARQARDLKNLLRRLEEQQSPYLKDVDWLIEQRDKKAFVGLEDYRSAVAPAAQVKPVDEHYAVTLEISALQYFPWLIAEARQAIERR